MPPTLDDPGLDTALARALHADGRLDLAQLRELLFEARGSGPGGATLARTICSRGLLSEEQVQAYLQRMPSAHGPTQLGPYVLLRPLGAGGMGAVHLARHTETGAHYAVKTLPLGSDPELLMRFAREGQAQAAVDAHPNVVRVHATGQEAGVAYLVMDHVAGGDLAERMREDRPTPHQAAALVHQLAQGLAHVHAQGVLHRDIKPANVLLDETGRPLLVDFGLARLKETSSLTETGALMGTPAYMAPEQATGSSSFGPPGDVYGLGALLYALLCGQPPFSGGSVLQVLADVIEKKPAAPSRIQAGVPSELDRICLRCLEKEPDARYPSAAALAADLEAFLGDASSSPSPSPILPMAGIGMLVAVILIGILWPSPTAPRPEPPPQEVPEADGAEVALRSALKKGDATGALLLLEAVDGEPVEPLWRATEEALLEACEGDDRDRVVRLLPVAARLKELAPALVTDSTTVGGHVLELLLRLEERGKFPLAADTTLSLHALADSGLPVPEARGMAFLEAFRPYKGGDPAREAEFQPLLRVMSRLDVRVYRYRTLILPRQDSSDDPHVGFLEAIRDLELPTGQPAVSARTRSRFLRFVAFVRSDAFEELGPRTQAESLLILHRGRAFLPGYEGSEEHTRDLARAVELAPSMPSLLLHRARAVALDSSQDLQERYTKALDLTLEAERELTEGGYQRLAASVSTTKRLKEMLTRSYASLGRWQELRRVLADSSGSDALKNMADEAVRVAVRDLAQRAARLPALQPVDELAQSEGIGAWDDAVLTNTFAKLRGKAQHRRRSMAILLVQAKGGSRTSLERLALELMTFAEVPEHRQVGRWLMHRAARWGEPEAFYHLGMAKNLEAEELRQGTVLLTLATELGHRKAPGRLAELQSGWGAPKLTIDDAWTAYHDDSDAWVAEHDPFR